jgi:hypothetical protein
MEVSVGERDDGLKLIRRKQLQSSDMQKQRILSAQA